MSCEISVKFHGSVPTKYRYGSGDLSLGRLFWYRRFDSGMAAFLSCVAEIGEYAESKDKTFKLPYR